MDLKRIFQRRTVWKIALYKLGHEEDIFEIDQHHPIYIMGESGIRLNKKYQATVADPFLFVYRDRLYLFYEVQTDFGLGEIWAQSMDKQGAWICHGQVLKEDFHLSYPQVFVCNGIIYMIPETAMSGQVWLYTTSKFPYEWEKKMVLIDEPLVDPSIVMMSDGIYLFATTRMNQLKLFFSPNISQKFHSICRNISNDKSISRNAGKPFLIKNVLYRAAQNCSQKYGENIRLLQIDKLSRREYVEHIVISDLFKKKPKWMEEGYHHISTTSFMNVNYVAVDGMRKDIYLNTILLIFMKIINKIITLFHSGSSLDDA
jgi:flagellar basal body rod protein FlgC